MRRKFVTLQNEYFRTLKTNRNLIMIDFDKPYIAIVFASWHIQVNTGSDLLLGPLPFNFFLKLVFPFFFTFILWENISLGYQKMFTKRKISNWVRHRFDYILGRGINASLSHHFAVIIKSSVRSERLRMTLKKDS